MAESQSMTSAGVVAKALIEEHSDSLRESVAMIAAEIMEAEIERQIGAGKGEVSEARATHRNGYRQRPWATRVGEIELAVPRKRSGESYFPSFLEPRKRSEKALLGVVMEAYVNGVSTRKVDHLVSELGIRMSKDQVSRICLSSTVKSRPSAAGPWRAPTPTCGSTPSTSRSGTRGMSTPRR
jgi:putative transposase